MKGRFTKCPVCGGKWDHAKQCGRTACKKVFIPTKPRQVYCSDICSAESQRDNKRRWWAEHGIAMRKAKKNGSEAA